MATMVFLLVFAGLYVVLVVYLVRDVFKQTGQPRTRPERTNSLEQPRGPESGDTRKAA